MTGNKADPLGKIPVGQGNTRIGGGTAGGRDARHHFEGDAGLCQSLQLLAAATEDKGIAPFEPDHGLAGKSLGQQQTVDFTLRSTVLTGPFAHGDALGTFGDQRQDLGTDQGIEQHHIGALQQVPALTVNSSGSPGPAPSR